eukprot:Gb_34532 [translate_table: standard]
MGEARRFTCQPNRFIAPKAYSIDRHGIPSSALDIHPLVIRMFAVDLALIRVTTSHQSKQIVLHAQSEAQGHLANISNQFLKIQCLRVICVHWHPWWDRNLFF